MTRKKFISSFLLSFLILFLSAYTVSVAAQTNKLPAGNANNLVSYGRNGAMSAGHLNQRIKAVFGQTALNPALEAVNLYKINYRSQNAKGKSVVLSGLLALPKTNAPKGLVIFNHGTTADRNLSPSRYKGNVDSSETELAILAFASGGYAVAMPDYLGLGDEKSFHPYPLGSVNSRSAIDLIKPARTIAAQNGIELGSNLFITGYSEGGAVAMWTVYELENKSGKDYQITAAAPMSGSYDLSGTTRNWLIASPTDQAGFVIRLYLLSYIAYSSHKNQGVKLTDYFKPSMALTISQAYKTNRSDEAIIKRLALAATLMRAKNSLENVLTGRFMDALRTSDTNDPVIRELKNNDIFDWLPQTDMLLINLEEDKIVDPGNTDKAFETMKKRGSSRAKLDQFIIKDKKFTHITGVAPALLQARRFFDKKLSK